jgi:hypothetical protein
MKSRFLATLQCPAVLGLGMLSFMTASAQISGGGALIPDTLGLPELTVEHWTGWPKGYKPPKEVDLSQWLPPAGDQGRQCSCVPWALCYGVMSYRQNRWDRRRYDPDDPVDSAKTFSPAYLYNLIIGMDRRIDEPPADSVCENGTDIDKVLVYAMLGGACSLKDMPYDTTLNSCCKRPHFDNDQEAIRHRIPPATILQAYKPEQWQYHLAKKQPILTGIVVDQKLLEDGIAAGGDSMIVYELWPDGGDTFGHAMVCTGYNDDSTFTFLNSWGRDWGLNGYCKVRMNTLEQKCYGGYVLSNDSSTTWERTPGRPANKEATADTSESQRIDQGEYRLLEDYKLKLVDMSKRDRTAVMQLYDARTDTLVRTVHMLAAREYHIYQGDLRISMSYVKRWFLQRWLGVPVRTRTRSGLIGNDAYLRERNARLARLKAEVSR